MDVNPLFPWPNSVLIRRLTVPLFLLVLFTTQLACGASLDDGGTASEPLPEPTALATPSEPERDEAEPETAAPALLEPRRLNLEWPAAIRVGDSGLVYLTIEVDGLGGLTPTVIDEGSQTRGETIFIPNLYDTHDILVEARLEIAGVEIAPTGEIIEPLNQGQSVRFVWSVRPESVGSYRGVIWLHVLLVPLEGAHAGQVQSRQTLSAQVIEFQGTDLFGLSGFAARVLGGVGAVVGSVFGLDNVLGLLWKRLKKIRKRTSVIDLSE